MLRLETERCGSGERGRSDAAPAVVEVWVVDGPGRGEGSIVDVECAARWEVRFF